MPRSSHQVALMKAAMHEEDRKLREFERQQIHARVGTRQTIQEIDEIIARGGDALAIVELIAHKIYDIKK